MGKSRLAAAGAERLQEGLNYDERIARLEGRVLGHGKAPGLSREHQLLLQRVEELESAERQRRLPWYVRWAVRPSTGARL